MVSLEESRETRRMKQIEIHQDPGPCHCLPDKLVVGKGKVQSILKKGNRLLVMLLQGQMGQ